MHHEALCLAQNVRPFANLRHDILDSAVSEALINANAESMLMQISICKHSADFKAENRAFLKLDVWHHCLIFARQGQQDSLQVHPGESNKSSKQILIITLVWSFCIRPVPLAPEDQTKHVCRPKGPTMKNHPKMLPNPGNPLKYGLSNPLKRANRLD